MIIPELTVDLRHFSFCHAGREIGSRTVFHVFHPVGVAR